MILGIPKELMYKHFGGEIIYNAETEIHFPNLTVGQTLSFAAKARVPRNRPQGVTRQQYADHFRDVAIALFGLSHTVNTRVGNEYIRGVSGGKRKRVSIAEAFLAGCTLQCWYVDLLSCVLETLSYYHGSMSDCSYSYFSKRI
jgi:ATP-binding cassette subfamily G (WHITE) protein 2 (PDR)